MRYLLYAMKKPAIVFREEGLRGLILKLLQYPVKILLSLYYTVTIKNLTRGYSPEALVDFVFTKSHGLLSPLQIRNEIVQLVTTVDKANLSEKEWLHHAYEEALDMAIYLKRIMSLKK